ncbi:hypothetical protein [Brevibacillus aydinogluensis]|uniref:Uncharacterized protein n=1 Tax=Brevibacillus aydinogluensis TaxID=927786 RepID=A0AA48M7I6_9BACL|nr:hypothetical protein [Brevibacillus aydinogluensis]CAJ1002696.1 hypothetical protein BSPP4475_10240 [Brevibacillus aydinogluensis]
MKKKEVKRLLRDNPDFKAWLMQDAARISSIRSNPEKAGELFRRWKDRKKGRLTLPPSRRRQNGQARC